MMLAVSILLALSTLASSAVGESSRLRKKGSAYPFSNIVAFGDELSDNGSGSYAHGMTAINGQLPHVYGEDRWTNGDVAVEYLAKSLGVSLNDYAFGGCQGGDLFGATLDNAYTPSQCNSQSLVDQVNNYTGSGAADVKNSMGFVWIGQNDLLSHTVAIDAGSQLNRDFYTSASTKIAAQVQRLFDAGMPYVLVANIYPKHLAPVTPDLLFKGSPWLPNVNYAAIWGFIITWANFMIEGELNKLEKADNIIYYDVFQFMTSVYNNPSAYGFTAPNSNTVICDNGELTPLWTDCITNNHGDKYMWVNYVQPTTKFHEYIAADMKKHVDMHFNAKK